MNPDAGAIAVAIGAAAAVDGLDGNGVPDVAVTSSMGVVVMLNP